MFNESNVIVNGGADLASTLQTYKTVVLKYNIVDGHNLLTQAMVSHTNTKYVIKWDYELAEDITIPANCVLEFDGGSLNGNLNIIGNGCIIEGNPNILCNITGIGNKITHLSWFTKDSNKNTAFNRALACAGTSILDGDNDPINLSQTVTFDASKKCDLLNLVINFTASSNGQSMFLFNAEALWTGNHGTISHCKFTMTNPNDYQNVHCIHYRLWNSTSRGKIDDVQVIDFTGYMFICESYLQEFSFERFKGLNVGGFISFNKEFGTDDAFGDYGVGKSNILSFIQCGIDNELNQNSTITDIVDLTGTIEATFINCVWQGGGRAGANGMNITAYDASYNPEIVLINCWFEFSLSTPQNNRILIGERVILRCNHTPTRRFYFKGSNAILYVGFNNMVVEDVDVIFAFESGVYPKIVIEGTINHAIVSELLKTYENLANISIDAGSFDGKNVKYSKGVFVDLFSKLNSFVYNTNGKYIVENGVKLFRLEESRTDVYFFFEYYNKLFTKFFNSKQAVFYRLIYRVIPNNTITSENIDNYKPLLVSSTYISNIKDTSKSSVYLGQDTDPANAEWHEVLCCTFVGDMNYNEYALYFGPGGTGKIDVAVCELWQGDVENNTKVMIDTNNSKNLLSAKSEKDVVGNTRPTLNTTSDIGFCMFDVTIGKPIWWNGIAWVDATGATV